MINKVTELLPNFIGKGRMKMYQFKQIKNNEFAYIYELRNIYTDNIHYEVFKRKITNTYDYKTKTLTHKFKVSYPNDKDFGKWAWSIVNKDKAFNKFNHLSELGKQNIIYEKI